MITILALVGCHTDPGVGPGGNTAPPDTNTGTHVTPTDPTAQLPDVCDAGDDVWVQRVFPLLLGRKPHGEHEVRIWSDLAASEGRDAVIRSLAKSPEYLAWWKLQMSDMVAAERTSLGVDDSNCFQNPIRPSHDGDLVRFLRSSGPDGNYGPNFNMADVILDSLVADDVSTVYQANLFAKFDYTYAFSADLHDLEDIIRQAQGDQLLSVYIDRNVSCMQCHNSEFSVTDDPDPALDRAWGRGPLFEQALFGASGGPPNPEEFYAISKAYGVTDTSRYYAYYPGAADYDYTHHPWGIDQSCGTFTKGDPKYDYNDVQTAFFGEDFGPGGSTFDIERMFAQGVDDLQGAGVEFTQGASIEPGQAFAYLTAQNFADQTWKQAFGSRLLLGYGISRNQAQQQRLAALTDHFVADGWSLTELLVDITSDPYFNAGMPGTCDTADYGMDPVVDPYTVLNEGELANNGPGELVHRHTARTLLRSLYDSMNWGQPPEYFGFSFRPDAQMDLQTALGVYLSDASPGFNGIDFQGALTWESNFYTCKDPDGSGAGYLRDLFAVGRTQDATVEDEVLALKDRLTSRGVIEDDNERQLIEDLMQVPLDSKVSEIDESQFARNFSLLCGVLTQSPEFLMTVEPRAIGPAPKLTPELAYDCESFVDWTARAGFDDLTCE